MKVQELPTIWESMASGELTKEAFNVRLPVAEAAKLSALAEMYPLRSMQQLITDLLTAALNELETGFPYVSGNKVVATDEEGDPHFEDIGPTPRYLNLTKKHLSLYRNAN